MKIYHSGLSLEAMLKYNELFPTIKLNVLRSYGRPSRDNFEFCDIDTHRDKIGSLAYDSGTFTKNMAKVHKVRITLEAFRKNLMVTAPYYDLVFNFDEDFTPAGFQTNWTNQTMLEADGHEIIPIIHDISGDEVDFYIDHGYPLVAIGSGELEKCDLAKLAPVVNKLYDEKVKVHFLGAAKYRLLSQLPVHSCDSSSWTQAGARGYIWYWNPLKDGADKTDKVSLEDHFPFDDKKTYFTDYEYKTELTAYLAQELSLTYDDLMGDNAKVNRALVNIHYFCKLEEEVNQVHQARGFITD